MVTFNSSQIDFADGLLNNPGISDSSKEVIRTEKEKLEQEKEKCQSRSDYIADWAGRTRNNDFEEMLAELKAQAKEWLMADGVGDDFFEEGEENQEEDEEFFKYFKFYLGCFGVVPFERHPSAMGYELNTSFLKNFAVAQFGIPLQRQKKMYLYKVLEEEWESLYGAIPNQQCCFYGQSLTSYGIVTSIKNGDMVVNTTQGQQRLKVKECSQIYRLDNGSQRVLFKYENNQK